MYVDKNIELTISYLCVFFIAKVHVYSLFVIVKMSSIASEAKKMYTLELVGKHQPIWMKYCRYGVEQLH